MAVITATNLSKAYGPEDIFSGISLSVPKRARAAIVGPNGIGKTTLLRILAGEESPSSGAVHLAKNAKLGYLPQEARFSASHTLWDECLTAFKDLLTQAEELRQLEERLTGAPEDAELLTAYGKRAAAFEHAGGYTYETRMKMVLTGLGFTANDYTLTLKQLSGGQRTRALLARLLLSNPDLLVLDEPTNHLDIAAVEWLESFLRDWEGAALIVSHDRYFLDRVVTHIYEMSRVGFETYRGSYTAYTSQRQARWEERRQHIESEVAVMEKELAYIRKNIAGQRTQMAKGKLSRLSRQIDAIEKLGFLTVRGKKWSQVAHEMGGKEHSPMRVEEAARRLNALKIPDPSLKRVNLTIRPKSRSGEIVLRAKDLQIGFPEKTLFHLEDLDLRRLECAALIGPNGAGKTTFLRAILNQLQPLAGEIKLGASLKTGYFTQAHEDLNPNLTLIEEIDRLNTGLLEKDIRSYLGRFLFSGRDHYKQVSVLSGGERGRLALAKLSLLDANFLLLDEPTNHLDIPGQEILQQVLADFDGTILMVSHDRYLIDALATQIWAIDPADQSLEIFKGSYTEYKQKQETEELAVSEVQPKHPIGEFPADEPGKPVAAGHPGNGKKNAAVESKALSKHQRQRLQSQVAALEDRILTLESKLEEVSQKLQDPPASPEDIRRLGEDYAALQAQLDSALAEWEELQSVIN